MSEQSVNGCKRTHSVFWGKDELEKNLATQCRNELEERTKEPHAVGFFKGVGGREPVDAYYFVYKLVGCRHGAKYDDKISLSNKERARECADALKRLTGIPHIAQSIERFFWADAFEVLEFPELP